MENIAGLQEAIDYINDMNEYGYNHTFDELSFSRGKRNYDRIFKTLSTIKLPNIKSLQYQSLTYEELKQYLETILLQLLGPTYQDEIKKYNNMLSLEDIPNPFDATLETTYQNGMWVPLKYHISNKLSSIEVISTAHEYIHGLLSKYTIHNFNNVLSNIHYKEFLSILVEYITCSILKDLLQEEDLPTKHKINRVAGNHLMTLESNEVNNLRIALNKVKITTPDIVIAKKYIEFDDHKTYGYIISDIYANRLFLSYLDDPKTLLTFIRHIIAGEQSIKDLIKYYNLSLSSYDTINPYLDSLKYLNLH